MRRNKQPGNEIAPVRYSPPGDYGLDLEIFPASALKQRIGTDRLRGPERIEFHLLICVTAGRCAHTVDFESVACKAGSILILRPGQVQRFDAVGQWQGWLVIFRPEFLQPRNAASVGELETFRQLDELPAHLTLNPRELKAATEGIARMCRDSQLDASTGSRHALLRYELQALLVRLHLAQAHREQTGHVDAVLLQRFKRYRLAVEQEFPRRHKVAYYAKRLGCSEKSLSRAALEIAGVNAKKFLTQRIALEAKRLLAHTILPVSTIADRLGFDEATNFVKFFRRQAGRSPGVFRKLHARR